MGSINNLTASYLQSAVRTAFQSAGLNTQSSSVSASSRPQQPDTGQLSPLARVVSTLQQLQQSDPTKYAQVTAQISTNLATAAQTAQSEGNTTVAKQLTQLSSDFSTASKSGQLPNFQDLAKAVGGHHHGHGHHSHAVDPDGDGDSSSTTASPITGAANSSSTTNSLASPQAGATPSDSLDPTAIILNTLAGAGITSSNG